MPREATWRKALPVHPAANKLRPATPEEIQNLAGDLKRHGQHERVVLVRIAGGAEQLLDGRTRLDVQEALGKQVVDADGKLTVASRTVDLPNDAAALDYVLSLNLHRRHLSLDDRRKLIKDVLSAAPQKSNRQVAEIIGMSHPAVAVERRKLEATGDVEKFTTSVDTKGRKQPTRKVRKQPATKVKVKPAEVVAAATEVGINETVIEAHGPQEGVRRIVQRIKRSRAKDEKEKLAVEIERLASKLIELDRNTARTLHDLLWKDERLAWRLTLALARGLGLDDDNDNNDVDPTASAEAMKARFAAEGGAS
jgi:DNA-binding Lrp family transcriptional regulator